MSITEVPFRSIRIPRFQSAPVDEYSRGLYELFGFRVHCLAKDSNSDALRMIVPSGWSGIEVVAEFDRIAVSGAKSDPVGQAVEGLAPMEFLKTTIGTPVDAGAEAAYKALSIDYRIIYADGAKFIVLTEYVDYVMRLIEAADVSGRSVGREEPAPVQPRAVRISKNDGDTLPVPETIKFADVYECQPRIMEALAKMFGAKYVKMKLIYGCGPGESLCVEVFVLDGLGRTAAERAKVYRDTTLAEIAAARSHKIKIDPARSSPLLL